VAGIGKDATKRMARPVLAPLLARLDALRSGLEGLTHRTDGVEERMDRLEVAASAISQLATTNQRVARLERQFLAFERTLNDVFEALTTQNSVARATRKDFLETVSRMERRIEFIRRELLIEARYGAGAGAALTTEAKVLNPEKLEAAEIRLNLGCGHLPLEGYVNVDDRALPGVDLVADVADLPFEPSSLQEIRSAHLLEHFPGPKLDRLLQYWCSLIHPQGTFVAIVPDAESMIEAYVNGEMGWANLKEVTYGGQEYAGDFHFTMFSQEDLRGLLAAAGFVDVRFVETGRPNGSCLEMEVVASKRRGE